MKKRIISLMLVLTMMVGMVPMLGISINALGAVHDETNELKCMLVPYAYNGMKLFDNSTVDPYFYFQAYKVLIHDGYDAKWINNDIADSSFNAIIEASLESYWHALGASVRQISSQILDQDFEIEKIDIYNNLLVNSLLDNAVEKITVEGTLEIVYNSISDFLNWEITSSDGMTLSMGSLINSLSDDALGKLAELLYVGIEHYDEASKYTTVILDGVEYAVKVVDFDDNASKFVDNVLKKITPNLTVSTVKEAFGNLRDFFEIASVVGDASALIANYLTIYDEVSNNVIPVLVEMHKITDDELLQRAIAKYIGIIDATSKIEIFKYIVHQIGGSLVELGLKECADKIKEYFVESNKYYAAAVLIYDLLDIIGGVRDKTQYDLIIWYVNKYNLVFSQAMRNIQGYCFNLKNDPNAVLDYCKAYIQGLYMHLNLLEYEQKLVIGYCEAWKLNDTEIQVHKDHLNNLVNINNRRKNIINNSSLYKECVNIVLEGTNIKYIVNNSVIAEQNKPYGEIVNILPDKPQKQGYVFNGWRCANTSSGIYTPGEMLSRFIKNNNGEATEYSTLPCFCGNEIFFTAQWVEQQNTITYNANGGTGAPASHENTVGNTTLSTTVPTRTGYTFLGWSESATGAVKYQPGAVLTKEGNVTLYAIWQAGTFNVVFHANEGKFSDNTDSKTMQKVYSQAFTVNPGTLTRDGYTFSGEWTENADGSGHHIYQGTTLTDIDGKSGLHTRHFYAKWIKTKTHAEFRYDYNNCSDYNDSTLQLNNGVLSVKLVDPPQNILDKFATAGKKFVKWMYIKPDGSTEYYKSGDTLTITNPGEPRECVYAIWEVASSGALLSVLTDKTSYLPGDTATLTITADNSGYFTVDVSENNGFKIKCADGSTASSGVFVEKSSASTANTLKCYDNGSAYTVKVYIPNNCSDGTYTVDIVASNGTYGVSGTETSKVTETITITVDTSEEEVATYVLSYDLNGGHGSIPDSEYFEEYEPVELADDSYFEREGYEFVGWSKENDGGGKTYKAGRDYEFGESVVLYAIWEPIPGYGKLNLDLMVERYSKVYKPGETAHVFVYPDYSNHFYFDVSSCSGFTVKGPAGNKLTGATWFDKTSPNYDSSKEGYTDGGMIPVYVYIPNNCRDGQYTFFVTASNGVLDDSGNSGGDKVKKSVTIYVRKSDKADSIHLSKTAMTIHRGSDKDIDATVEPSYIFNHYNEKEVSWQTSNSRVASINTKGNTVEVFGGKVGTATITATVDGVSATCQVTVVNCDHSQRIIDSEYLASPATCANQATYYYVCECGDKGTSTYKHGDLAAHSYSAWSVIQQPTETTAGVEQRTCSGCQDTEERSIPATGAHTTHTPGTAWYSDSEKHWHVCSVDGCMVKLNEGTHTFGELSVETPTTETNTGIGYRACACGYSKSETIPVIEHVHDWGTVTYTWTADGSNCTAQRVCTKNSNHEETAIATITSAEKIPATETVKGTTTYTATFTESWATAQTKDIQDIPMSAHTHNWGTVTYTWEEDGSSCTAQRVCTKNSNHKETATATITSAEKVPATETVEGTTTYTATFTENWATAQTKDVQDIPVTSHVHTWGTVTYTWAEDGSSCTAQRVCTKDSNHKETAIATITSAEKIPATETVEGTTTYTATFTENWAARQTKDIQDIPTVQIQHNTSNVWTSDSTHHWHNCSCGNAHDKQLHTESEWIVDEAATASKNGSRHKECIICEYITATDIIPATGSNSDENFWLWYVKMLKNRELDITASVTEGGTISSVGTSKVKYGQNVTYTITPNKGYTIADVLVDGKSVGAVSEYTFKRVNEAHTISAIFEKLEWTNPFNDVSKEAWYYEDIEFTYENNLMIGTGDDIFSPNAIVNRAMLVTVLWRLEGSPIVESSVNFVDIPSGEWYTDAVNWAAANGIVNGYGDDIFGATKDLTHEQVAAILNRYAVYKKLSENVSGNANDAYTNSEWAENNVLWADLNGMFDGIGSDISNLTKGATRAELAAYLRRFCENVME